MSTKKNKINTLPLLVLLLFILPSSYASQLPEDIYNKYGFNKDGIHKDTSTKWNLKGVDKEGLYVYGYSKDKKYVRYGFLGGFYSGYDKEGYSFRGFDKNGYNRSGYNRSGYDKDGYNKDGWDIKSLHKDTGTEYNKYGFNREDYDEDGYNPKGYNKYGLNWRGFNKYGIHKDTWTKYDKYGYDQYGFNKYRSKPRNSCNT